MPSAASSASTTIATGFSPQRSSGRPDDRDFAHLRQLVDDALDLGGGDVLAAGDDHVLLAVGEIEKAFVVEVTDVAGAEPVSEEGGLRLLRVLPVAARHLRSAQADFAVLAGGQAVAVIVADLDLDMGEGAPRGANLLDLSPCFHERVAADAFGQPIAVDVTRVLEQAGEGANARLRRPLAAADHPFQAGDVVP